MNANEYRKFLAEVDLAGRLRSTRYETLSPEQRMSIETALNNFGYFDGYTAQDTADRQGQRLNASIDSFVRDFAFDNLNYEQKNLVQIAHTPGANIDLIVARNPAIARTPLPQPSEVPMSAARDLRVRSLEQTIRGHLNNSDLPEEDRTALTGLLDSFDRVLTDPSIDTEAKRDGAMRTALQDFAMRTPARGEQRDSTVRYIASVFSETLGFDINQNYGSNDHPYRPTDYLYGARAPWREDRPRSSGGIDYGPRDMRILGSTRSRPDFTVGQQATIDDLLKDIGRDPRVSVYATVHHTDALTAYAAVHGMDPARLRQSLEHTVQSINTVHPAMRASIALGVRELFAQGHPVYVEEGWRDPARQSGLVAGGASRAGPGMSFHNYALAVDARPMLPGRDEVPAVKAVLDGQFGTRSIDQWFPDPDHHQFVNGIGCIRRLARDASGYLRIPESMIPASMQAATTAWAGELATRTAAAITQPSAETQRQRAIAAAKPLLHATPADQQPHDHDEHASGLGNLDVPHLFQAAMQGLRNLNPFRSA